MNLALLKLLASTAFPIVSELASSFIYPRVVALATEGTNLLETFDASHPLVAEAVAFAKDMLPGDVTEGADVEAALAKIVQAGLAKLAALDPSVTGTTVTAPTVASVGTILADEAGTETTSVLSSVLGKIEGIFSKHVETVATAAGNAAASAASGGTTKPAGVA